MSVGANPAPHDRDDPRRSRTIAWTRQLHREYRNILHRHHLSLRQPAIAVESLAGRWGAWDPVTRTLTVSAALIEQYPWDVVIEVLKHEVAHQIVSEVYGLPDASHRDAFQAACERLGLNGWATKAAGDLPGNAPRWSGRALSDEDERLLDRANKLLALATSSNEHEAALAMQRVKELYARHNIEQTRRGGEPEMVYTIIGRKRRRMEATERSILAILVEHFFVEVIHGNQYDAHDQVEYRIAEVIGSPANVAMAEYVYAFLLQTIQWLWDQYRADQGARAGARNSYQLGVLTGFGRKLADERCLERVGQELGYGAIQTQALIRQRGRDIERFLHRRYPRLRVMRSAGVRFDRESYAHGVEAGKQVTIRKGIEEKRGNRGNLLGT